MTDHVTRQEIEDARGRYWGGAVLSPWELQEALANAPHPCPLAALCDRRNWRRPSDADYAFIEACSNRLQLRLQQAIQPHP